MDMIILSLFALYSTHANPCLCTSDAVTSDIRYEMIFGSTEAQEVIAKAYHIILKARDDLLENGE
jgi:hypothetical protein